MLRAKSGTKVSRTSILTRPSSRKDPILRRWRESKPAMKVLQIDGSICELRLEKQRKFEKIAVPLLTFLGLQTFVLGLVASHSQTATCVVRDAGEHLAKARGGLKHVPSSVGNSRASALTFCRLRWLIVKGFGSSALQSRITYEDPRASAPMRRRELHLRSQTKAARCCSRVRRSAGNIRDDPRGKACSGPAQMWSSCSRTVGRFQRGITAAFRNDSRPRRTC